MKFIVVIVDDFLFGGNNSSESCLDSSDTKEDYTAKAFCACGGEGEKVREATLGLDLLWPAYVLDNSHFWGSEGPKIWTESPCEETLGIKFYAGHLHFSFDIQV